MVNDLAPKAKKLKVETSVMHRIDNMEDKDVSTTDLYKPKKGYATSNENLFTDEYSDNSMIDKSDDIHIGTVAIIVGVIVVIGIAAVCITMFL